MSCQHCTGKRLFSNSLRDFFLLVNFMVLTLPHVSYCHWTIYKEMCLHCDGMKQTNDDKKEHINKPHNRIQYSQKIQIFKSSLQHKNQNKIEPVVNAVSLCTTGNQLSFFNEQNTLYCTWTSNNNNTVTLTVTWHQRCTLTHTRYQGVCWLPRLALS